MEKTLDAFDDYRDKIKKMDNALDARDYYLEEMTKHCGDMLESTQEATESLKKASNNLQEVKEALIPEPSVN